MYILARRRVLPLSCLWPIHSYMLITCVEQVHQLVYYIVYWSLAIGPILGTIWKTIQTNIVMQDITGPGGATMSDLQQLMRGTVMERDHCLLTCNQDTKPGYRTPPVQPQLPVLSMCNKYKARKGQAQCSIGILTSSTTSKSKM